MHFYLTIVFKGQTKNINKVIWEELTVAECVKDLWGGTNPTTAGGDSLDQSYTLRALLGYLQGGMEESVLWLPLVTRDSHTVGTRGDLLSS